MKTKDITISAMMAALVFIGTFFFKIPSPFGYTHLGDCFIILTVILLGYKKGCFAGMIGAGLADFIGGYMEWVLPTVIIKGIYAFIIGMLICKLGKENKLVWIGSCMVAGIFHVAAYSLVRCFIYGPGAAITCIPTLTGQTYIGVTLGIILAITFKKAGIDRLAASRI